MLDLYYIETDSDMLGMLEIPDESKWIGSIDLDQHKCLAALFDICEMKGIRFPYSEDSLLTFEQVKVMNKLFDDNLYIIKNENINTLNTYTMFKTIISIAIDKNAGIISFCD
jgi:hypothetical protein